MRKLTVDNCISKEFNQSDYLEGKSDGLNGALNKNVGHFTPSLSYELGFNAGTKERLLSEKNPIQVGEWMFLQLIKLNLKTVVATLNLLTVNQ